MIHVSREGDAADGGTQSDCDYIPWLETQSLLNHSPFVALFDVAREPRASPATGTRERIAASQCSPIKETPPTDASLFNRAPSRIIANTDSLGCYSRFEQSVPVRGLGLGPSQCFRGAGGGLAALRCNPH
ncbi:hypothetical protein CSOJ01_02424 [Colletotrichum sojae]|uniref:Uncharacterized protein n=1 Tax=Colletotrichum sojae TaxID=2175907 RepID=A0A8H6N230_9PEZI|nr:hypothetical protein CSOJ01_02424 [Colletotrichum sojae]